MLLTEGFNPDDILRVCALDDVFDYAKSRQLRVLSVSLDGEGNEEVEYMPLPVKSGNLKKDNDPDFINRYPKAQLPYHAKGKTLRLFQCEGNSTLPLPKKCRILGEKVEYLQDIEDGQLYLVISEKGYAIKKLHKKLHRQTLTLKSLNPLYEDYDINLAEIKEVWRFVLYLNGKSTRLQTFAYAQDLLEKIEEMRNTVSKGKIFGAKVASSN